MTFSAANLGFLNIPEGFLAVRLNLNALGKEGKGSL